MNFCSAARETFKATDQIYIQNLSQNSKADNSQKISKQISNND